MNEIELYCQLLNLHKQSLQEQYGIQSLGIVCWKGNQRDKTAIEILVDSKETLGIVQSLVLKQHLTSILKYKVELVTREEIAERDIREREIKYVWKG